VIVDLKWAPLNAYSKPSDDELKVNPAVLGPVDEYADVVEHIAVLDQVGFFFAFDNARQSQSIATNRWTNPMRIGRQI
jgi:hypothetical protein